MNEKHWKNTKKHVSAGCHINDVMNLNNQGLITSVVSAGCHINDVMNSRLTNPLLGLVSAGCHINDVMNIRSCCRL